MSTDLSSTNKAEPKAKPAVDGITWGPWSGLIVAVVVFYVAQLIALQIASIYPYLKHWSSSQTSSWINSSVYGQFLYVLMAEGLTLLFIWLFIRWRKGNIKAIGLKRPKPVEDSLYALTGVAIYIPIYIASILIVSALVPSLNLQQQQQIGFTGANGFLQLTIVFLSLVILPPIVEEIMFRGFVFSGLKKAIPVVWAALITSAVFAAPHLLEGDGGGLLWVAGIDTFILSLVLCWLRQKTGRLYAGMGLHALKNFVAFASIFLFHVR